MRLPERYKQTIYIANETWYGSDTYDPPFKMRGIVSPKENTLLIGGGVQQEQNSVIIQFESDATNVHTITTNSHVWLRKTPDPSQDGGDFTHAIVSRDTTAHSWYITIEARSVAGNTPII
jgi:hypothetical protein